jgi:anaerobic dimethyl sulfoxide reductase subunit A
VSLPFDPAFSSVPYSFVPAGKFATETGRIQFFSPFFFNRDQALGSSYQKPDGGYYRSTFPPKAMYARPHEGYEDIVNGTNVGAKGLKYTLQFTTNHSRSRAHTVYDNVPMIKDQFPSVVRMHPIDAAARGISNGDAVYLYNDWGCIKSTAVVTVRWKPGVVDIQDGSWYRASTTETYEAWFDTNMDGIPEKHVVPVDVGGCPNTITHDYDDGPLEAMFVYATCNNHYNGNLCEVSLTKPQ